MKYKLFAITLVLSLFVFCSCSKKQDKAESTISKNDLKSNAEQVEYIKKFFGIKGKYWVDTFCILQFENEDSTVVRNKYLFNLKVDSKKVKCHIVSKDTVYRVLGTKESFKIKENGALEVYENDEFQYSLPLQKN